ncbi:DsrE/DsrF/DrsH-like family protein [Halobacteriaceae archaeon GCM10025711]
MSSESTANSDETGVGPDSVADLQAKVEALEQQVEDLEAEVDDGQKQMTIIATKGSLDMAYPPLILASTAAAFGWDVVVFYTFWGLDVLHEEKAENLKLSAVGNTSMPLPNSVAVLPFMDDVATRMMKKEIDDNGTASVKELIDLSLESGVDLQACQMTMELLDYESEDLIDGVTDGVGAATALQHMADSDVQLMI